jgi:formamidopyrimidine-DNA glycosylase
MTGSLRVHTRPPERRTHGHIDIVFGDGSLLRYHDPRRFGAMLWAPDPALSHPLLRDLGPEPFDAAFDTGCVARNAPRRAAIKFALMDSHVVVGVGNIYANEALFRAGIRPTVRANRLSRPRLARLVDAVRAVLTEAIAKGGSTLRDYVDAVGEPGYFQLDYFVYGREGEPCRICGTPTASPAGCPRLVLLSPLPALTQPPRDGRSIASKDDALGHPPGPRSLRNDAWAFAKRVESPAKGFDGSSAQRKTPDSA